jgi:two-component system sensor histidine kinase/response regulator
MDTLRVLVADDEAGIRHAIGRALRGLAVTLPEVGTEVTLEVSGVASGEEALERIAGDGCDLLLLDYKMEGISGMEVLERLGDETGDMLVVMVTAFATIETAVRATKSGAFDFITKPFTPSELRDTVQKAALHLVARRRARRMEEEKRRIRFDFIRVLGHELKAPLGAIESYLGLLQNHTAGDDLCAYDQMVDRCVARAGGMRKLIGDLLDLTRIESGQKRREFCEFDLTDLARGAAENVAVDAAARGIEIEVDAPRSLAMTGDRGELEIVLNNLVSNAVKYNADGGSVSVRLWADDDRIRVDVEDTGIGLSVDDVRRLFNDFVRIKSDRTRSILGSGLGLSIVKKIAALYDGSASVVSEPGRGSTFTVELCRWNEAAEPETRHVSDAAREASNSREAAIAWDAS